MARRKIQHEAQLRAWIEDGVPYKKIVQLYAAKYPNDEPFGVMAVSSFAHRNNLKKRKVRDENLIPWSVEWEHRNAYLLEMLRLEARVRAGEELDERETKRHKDFMQTLAEMNAVVTYDPTTDKGFHRIPREDTDTDIVRVL